MSPHFTTAAARVVLAGLVAATSLAAVGADPAGAATPPTPRVALGGGAYGSTVRLSTANLSSGKTSYVTMCTTRDDYTTTNRTGSLDLGPAGTIGAVTTSTTAGGTRARAVSTTRSRTAATSLLGGLITVSAIDTTARASLRTTADPGRATLSGASTLTGLTIAGIRRDSTPKPGTTVALPGGLGTVELNRQTSSRSYGNSSISVTALKVTVLPGNSLGLPSGTIVVGQSTASAHRRTVYRPYGSAYGTQANVQSTVKSGPTAYSPLPCGGTGGATRTNHIGRTSVPGLYSVGAVTSAARSTQTAQSAKAVTRARAASVNLLDGLVTVKAVDATASATKHGATVARSSHTSVAGLRINGHSRTVTVKENTKITVNGIGTLWLQHTTRTATGVTVNGIELQLAKPYAGQPAGTTITVASARAGVAAR